MARAEHERGWNPPARSGPAGFRPAGSGSGSGSALPGPVRRRPARPGFARRRPARLGSARHCLASPRLASPRLALPPAARFCFARLPRSPGLPGPHPSYSLGPSPWLLAKHTRLRPSCTKENENVARFVYLTHPPNHPSRTPFGESLWFGGVGMTDHTHQQQRQA